MGARETALKALIACRKDGAWSNGALKDLILRDKLDGRDAALASRLCYGVIQNRNLLDFYLKQLLTGRMKDLPPVLHDILHLGLYQISFMDKIPASAAVNESVELAKRYCKRQRFAPGLANAVLRNAVRTKGTWIEPTSLEDRYSHPAELIQLLERDLGKERLEPMLRANNDTPQTVVQVNTLRTTAENLAESLGRKGVEVSPHAWMPDCLVLGSTGNLERLEAFQKGLFYVQDPAARLSVLCAGIEEGSRVLDCCAAPGGKSFAAAIAMKGSGSIISCDIHPHKTLLIQNGARRLGLETITAAVQDAARPRDEWVEAMDVVLADVPCSGYGIIRKKPDIRFKSPKSMEELPALQLEILCNQANYVKQGGVLLYSTCTLLKRENEEVVRKFLRLRGDFEPEPLPLPPVFPDCKSGMLTLVPGEYDTDGFFIAKLRRKSCTRI